MAHSAPEIAEFGRFVEPALLILVSLTSGPKHGYAMIEDIETLWSVRLGPGTLYGALARLEREGLIAPLDSSDRRRPYRLTAAGSALVGGQLQRLQSLSAVGLGRLASL